MAAGAAVASAAAAGAAVAVGGGSVAVGGGDVAVGGVVGVAGSPPHAMATSATRLARITIRGLIRNAIGNICSPYATYSEALGHKGTGRVQI
ncbi:MAG: hypothetical protein QGI09_02210 [Dehalococcoidia bacterium]|nr:hypothetical protein [Dehalococcoidia bacterium]